MAFTGSVALVTGAGSGMGRMAARRLAEAGARVAAWDVHEEGLRATAADLDGIHPFRVDVTDLDAVRLGAREVESALGPVDRVMNGAAILPLGPLVSQDAADIQRAMEINYGGTVNVSQTLLPGMLERGRGDLINFASVAGFVPFLHFGAYNATKFAVVAYTEVLAHENRQRGVRFACVCPPPVATPMLEQVKNPPKVLDEVAPLAPEKVLDALERDLERGRLLVFPDASSRLSYQIRRLLPDLVWRQLHRIEGI